MRFDSNYVGPQDFTGDDRNYPELGSKYSEIRDAMFDNAYYQVWGTPGDPPLPYYGNRLLRLLRGILPFRCRQWRFLDAARRTLNSRVDLRWGPDGRGFRKLLHPNGVCLFGQWRIHDDEVTNKTNYTGYFRPKSIGLVIARYSTGIGIRRGDFRTLSLVGKIFPTINPDDQKRPANFITEEELGGAKTLYINDAELRNAPDTTPWRRRLIDFPKLLVTGFALGLADAKNTIRQLYEIAELTKPANEATRAPEFMRLICPKDQPRIYGDRLDLREEVLAQIYDRGDKTPKRSLKFDIEVSDDGFTKGRVFQRRYIDNWRRIGQIEFTEAVASYNGDFVLHFRHPPWRNDRNDPSTLARP